MMTSERLDNRGLLLAPELYGDLKGPIEEIPAYPPDVPIRPPAGKAAVTFFVAIPDQKADAAGRQVAYIDWSVVKKVVVTMSGENMANPVGATLNVASGAKTAAATLIVNAGRNQIITATAMNDSNIAYTSVAGVVTSIAGQVVSTTVKYGTTPLAKVVGSLDAAVAPQVNIAAISGVIDPITNWNGSSYSKHPLFIDWEAISAALKTLISSGKSPSSVTTQNINGQFGSTIPVRAAGSLSFRILNPDSSPRVFSQSARLSSNNCYPYAGDLNSDGNPDAVYCSTSYGGGYLYDIALNDPFTSSSYQAWSTTGSDKLTRSADLGGILPGTWKLSWGNGYGMSEKIWYVTPLPGSREVTIDSGSTATVDFKLVDVSKLVEFGPTGGYFTVPRYEVRRFSTVPNVLYTLTFANSGSGTTYLYDYAGNQLFATGISNSTDYASAATNSLYVHTTYTSSIVTVQSTELAESEAVLRSAIDFNQ